jgi:hypothetical protein
MNVHPRPTTERRTAAQAQRVRDELEPVDQPKLNIERTGG